MGSRDLRSEVIHFVADELGLSREKIRLSHRLVQDLGLHGDDAVDFFISVRERFRTNLTYLEEHWSDHFAPEGFSCWNALVFVPAGAAGATVAAVARLSDVWAVAIAAALLAAWMWAMERWGPPDGLRPVTVADLVAAVEAGAWPSPPQG